MLVKLIITKIITFNTDSSYDTEIKEHIDDLMMVTILDACNKKVCGDIFLTSQSVVNIIYARNVIKLPFISESYCFGFLLEINGNSGTDKVTVYRYKVTVILSQSYRLCKKVVMKVTVCPGRKLPFCSKVTVYIETHRYIKKCRFQQ